MVDETRKRVRHDTQMMLPIPGKSVSRLAHYQSLAKKPIPEDWHQLRAEIKDALDPKPVPGLMSQALEAFYAIRCTLQADEKIKYGTIESFANVTQIKLEAWECQLILELDLVFHNTIGESDGSANSFQHSH